MSKYNSLHQLVLSLSKSEKRFIKLNAQMHSGDKVYLKLLDEIAKQENYDEKELLKLFEGEDFTKQFSVAKNYLQNFILKQLRQYHSGLKASIECRNLLIDIELLFWKGQYKLAEKLIHKTEKIASKYDYFLILEELNYWHGRIYSALLKLDKDSVKKTTEKHKNNLEKYQNILDYYDLRSQMQLLIKESEVIRNSQEKSKYLKILQHPLIIDVNNAQSFYAKYTHYVLNSVAQSILGNFKEANKYQLLLFDYINENSWFAKENTILYTAVLHNLIKDALINKQFDKFQYFLDLLKNLKLKMPHEQANVFSKLCLFELGYYLQHNKLDEAKHFVEYTVNEYVGLSSILNKEHEYLLNYKTAIVYYYLHDYDAVLKWINKVINEPSKDLRIDIRCQAYIINIVVHFEKENTELLSYLVKVALNYFKSTKTLRKIDELFVNMFNVIPQNSKRRELIPFLRAKREELKSIKSKSIIVAESDYFDWIDSKIHDISIHELLKKKSH